MSEAALRRDPDEAIADAIAGDRAAFARLIEQHQRPMMRVAYVITGDSDSAADAVQAAWEIAWRRIGTVRERDRIGSWLVAIAANEARQTRRKRYRHQVVDISAAMDKAGGFDPAERIDLVDLKRAVARLSADDRMLLALRFVGHVDSAEIARQLGLSASGTRSRLMRLLERLRGELDPGSGGEDDS